MKLLIKLAWRNLWRNRRRSLLTLLAIAFATLASIGMRGIQHGTYAVNIENTVKILSGYLQIQPEGYQKNPTLNKVVRLDGELKEALDKTPGIKGYTPRISTFGLVSYLDNSFGTSIMGIDPESEKSVTNIHEKVKEGEFLKGSDGFDILLGYKLMENLKAEVGDEIVLLSQGYDGSLGNLKFRIAGAVKFGIQDVDVMTAFIGIETARELLAMWGKSNIVAISLNGLDDVAPARDYLKANMPDDNYKVLTWNEVMPDFEQTIALDNVSGLFFLTILVIIVAFGILNTLLMSVSERFREFGVSLSIGMPQMKLVAVVILESVFISFLGVLSGNILGYFLNSHLAANPITFGNEVGEISQEYGFMPIIQSTTDPGIFINISLLIMFIAILATLIPAYKVYRLEALKGIRYT